MKITAHKGVSFDKANGRYRARVVIEKKTYNIGSYPSEAEAVRAYQAVVTYRDPLSLIANLRREVNFGKRKYSADYLVKFVEGVS